MSPDDLNKFLSYFFTGLSCSFAIPFFYCVLFKSPPCIRIYRNTILNLAIWYAATMGTYAILLQPIYARLSNKSCARFTGLVSSFGKEFHIGTVFLTAISVENIPVAIIICFFYRYDQLRSINNVSFLKTHKGVIICVAVHIKMSIIASFIAYAGVAAGEIFEYKGTFFLCFSSDNYHMMKLISLAIGMYMLLGSIVTIVLAFLTILRLHSQTAHMTRRTYHLQQRLTINLVVLLFLPIIFDVIPICILCYMVYIKSDSLYFWVSFTSHTPFWDVMLSFLATLYFVTPYRNAVEMFWRRNIVMQAIPNIILS
ncbi:hypothetical protein QR680_015297 [Steinernema hermaphroditum]|uniref:Uncharacterized protein n=1 Tax=Steinernema hermaphroditum TaxID=289476 RepID=A0AA39H9T5_9BILA|nr:hypothetical protein QR680_015297 [Steinernema hermaphroditum]